jgi:hypothetical protein
MYRDELALLMRLAARKALQIHLDRNRDEEGYKEWRAVYRVTGKEPEKLYRMAEEFAAHLERPSLYGHTERFEVLSRIGLSWCTPFSEEVDDGKQEG